VSAAGQDASELLTERRLLGELYVAPYAVLEPEHAFVLDDGTGSPGGYIVGALDTLAFAARCEADWWPEVRARHPAPTGVGGLDDLFVALAHSPPLPDEQLVARYPSHLHIDLLPPLQSGGWGRQLVATLCDVLRGDGSPGVHLGMSTANERADGFYRHLGFVELADDSHTRTFGLLL